MELPAIESFLKNSPTVSLLRADHGAYILYFLQTAFRSDHGDASACLPQDELKHRLAVFQDELRAIDLDALAGPSDRYLLAWSDAGWIRRFLSSESSQTQYQLTRFAEEAIRFVDSAITRSTRAIGTESRLRLVIDTLSDVVRGATSDPEARLKRLLADRQRIDEEIEAIRSGAAVETYHPAQIRERFHTAVDLLKTLQRDFRAVEDRFEEIAREVQRESQATERTRGQILADALDAEDLLKEQDEGISFYAFVSFLFSPSAQAELRQTIAEVTRLEAIADERAAIEHVRLMVPSLLSEADNVLRQTGRLSHTLRRLLDAESAQHRRRTAEVLRDIRSFAAKLKQSVRDGGEPVPEAIGLRVETLISVQSPMSRSFWTPPQVFESTPESHVVDLEKAEREGRKLARLKRLELDRMRTLLDSVTQEKISITMSELVRLRKPTAGVMELVGWLQIAHEDGHRIDREGKEEIEVEGEGGPIRVRVPLVTYYRTGDWDNQTLTRQRPR